MTENLYDLFHGRFPADRSRAFIETADGRVYTYRDLERTSGRMARLLGDLGVRAGDRVAAQVDKSPQAIFLYLSCLRLGAVYVPLNTAYRTAEMEYFMSDAEPGVVVCRPDGAETIAAMGIPNLLTLDRDGGGTLVERSRDLDPDVPTAPVEADDLAAILYTSGTTGRSKGAMMSHRNLASNALTLHRAWGFAADDVLLHALPVFHTHGLFVATNCVLLNGTWMLFLNRFDSAEVIRLLPRATVFMGVPTHYVRLLGDPVLEAGVCRDMRLFISGSAPLSESVFEDFRERTGHTILERYGMTETCMNTSNPLDGPRRAGTVGPPLPGIEARVVDEHGAPRPIGEVGVLEVRGPNVFKGYWRMPEKTAAQFRTDGFFITGDLARIDDQGYVTLVGRDQDLIITGGYNVYPKEVEMAIDRLDGVAESAVFGVPHPDFGEGVTAVVARLPGAAAPTAGDIIRRLKEEIAAYKVPKQVFFVDDLPRNAMGKVQKNQLRERHKDAYGPQTD